ncbi:MAG: ORF6N domain-containing protein [Verrucomicrobiota bacterium]
MPKELQLSQAIEQRIFLIRGQRVMLGHHLAELYGVPAKALIQAVKRNRDRFPDDFMFQIDRQEFAILKSQIVTSSWGGIRRMLPYAFTEQGIAMLSSVLRSQRAIQINIAIVRTFIRLRKMIIDNKELALKLNQLEQKFGKHDEEIQLLFNVIKKLMTPPPEKPKKRIGFRPANTN